MPKSKAPVAPTSILSELTMPKGALKKLIGQQVYCLLSEKDKDDLPVVVLGTITEIDRSNSTCCVHATIATEFNTIQASLDQMFHTLDDVTAKLQHCKLSLKVAAFRGQLTGRRWGQHSQRTSINAVKAEEWCYPILWDKLVDEYIIDNIPEDIDPKTKFPNREQMTALYNQCWDGVIDAIVAAKFPNYQPDGDEEDDE